MTYQPAEDSYLLRDVVLKKSRNKKVLDMGAGSGILSVAAFEGGAKEVVSADIDEEALQELKRKKLKAIKSDLFSNIRGKFELIIFNPPYLPLDKEEDGESRRATTGGKRGDEIILRFMKRACGHLEKKGIILLLLSSLTPRKRINSLLEKKDLSYKIMASKNLFFEKLEVWEISY